MFLTSCLTSSWDILEAGKTQSCVFQSGSFSRDRLTGQLLELPSDLMLLDAVSMCVVVKFKKKKKKKKDAMSSSYLSFRTSEMTLVFWSMAFSGWKCISINVCVLFFSIHPSPSHEKHIGVS